MNLLSISGLAKLSRENYLFTDVTFGLNEGDKAALIGRNGTGKSTLLNTIAGVLEPDRGTVVINKEAGVSFLPQLVGETRPLSQLVGVPLPRVGAELLPLPCVSPPR